MQKHTNSSLLLYHFFCTFDFIKISGNKHNNLCRRLSILLIVSFYSVRGLRTLLRKAIIIVVLFTWKCYFKIILFLCFLL